MQDYILKAIEYSNMHFISKLEEEYEKDNNILLSDEDKERIWNNINEHL